MNTRAAGTVDVGDSSPTGSVDVLAGRPTPAADPPRRDVITVRGLVKRYGSTTAVEKVSFTVATGEIFGIVGTNGAGKTTTVECLQGLRHPDGGTVTVLGLDPVTEGRALRRRIGSQLQESALPDRMKVWEAVDLFASLRPGSVDTVQLLEDWELTHRRRASFGNLSGGERQRLFVALALLGDPEIVFLDELTQGLDPAARRVAWRLIERVRARGTTVIFVTHYMDEVERLCDRIVVVDRGRVIARGTPQQLIAESAVPLTVTFSIPSGDTGWLTGLDSVTTVTRHGDHVRVQGTGPVVVEVAGALAERGLAPTDLRVQQPGLEDVFLELTGRGPEEVA